MLRKKIIGLLLLATGWTACTQNFDEINTDPNRLEKIDPSTLMTPTLYDLANFNYNRAHSFTHHLMQFMVTTSTTGGVHRYADLQNAGNSTWNTYYLQLTNIKEMYELAQQGRIYVLPTHFDGLPGSVREAMFLKIPVITTPVGALPSLNIEKQCIVLSEVGNPEKLGGNIRRLLTDVKLYEKWQKINI